MDDFRADLHFLARRGPAQPVKAMPAYMTAAMTPEDAFRATVSDCLAQVTANAGTLRSGRSVEGLHQLRVGFRRLDVTLGAFGKEFGLPWLEELRSRGKVLSSRLASARDLDVFLFDLLDAPQAAAGRGERDSFDALRAQAERARDIAWGEACECVTGEDFAMFQDDVAALAQSRLPLGRQQNLPGLAERLLRRQARRVKTRGRTAASREARDLHHLRIALKKLRYAAEFFASLYPNKKSRRYLKKMRQLQDYLGELNDIAHVRATVSKLMRSEERTEARCDLGFAAGAVTGWYGGREGRIVKQTLKRYRKFRRLKPFWN
ncbi:MAG TPA: CHAD domain-containing protein [Rhizomicrobium sp.]|jgi:CHAD domain-containing protein|nr:CHAD domain-containing protein [Rhizomicrobium sp.]